MEETKLIEIMEKVFLEQNDNDTDYLEWKKDSIKGIAYFILNNKKITTSDDWEAVKDGRADFMDYDHWEIDLITETLRRLNKELKADKITPYHRQGRATIYNYDIVNL